MFTLNAPAKINWFLQVLFLREDGYHEIKSMMQQIKLFDILKFEHNHELSVISNLEIPVRENLVFKVAFLMKERYKVNIGARIHLKKHIPVSAGLGGGSSDAASTLIGLNKLWSLELKIKELHQLAESLGSDIPFFLYRALSLVEGRGEKITPCFGKKTLNLLLVKPPISISSAWAYKNLDHHKLTKRRNDTKMLTQSVIDADLLKMKSFLYNDLEDPVIHKYPIIKTIKGKLLAKGAVMTLMSGSGSTVFGVFDSYDRAENASAGFNNYWTSVVKTMS